MIRSLFKIPNKVTLACSGGPDSMAILDFLRKGRKDVRVAYFHHGTDHGDEAYKFILDYCSKNNISLVAGFIKREKEKDESPEEFWRNERLEFLTGLDCKVYTGHNLDDAVEWWMFTAMNGNARLIPFEHKNIMRPFLLTPKKTFHAWCENKNVPFVSDPGNSELRYARSRIRQNIMPEILKINPGIRKVISKKIKSNFDYQMNDVRPVC